MINHSQQLNYFHKVALLLSTLVKILPGTYHTNTCKQMKEMIFVVWSLDSMNAHRFHCFIQWRSIAVFYIFSSLLLALCACMGSVNQKTFTRIIGQENDETVKPKQKSRNKYWTDRNVFIYRRFQKKQTKWYETI